MESESEYRMNKLMKEETLLKKLVNEWRKQEVRGYVPYAWLCFLLALFALIVILELQGCDITMTL